jgi:hypothetical protein
MRLRRSQSTAVDAAGIKTGESCARCGRVHAVDEPTLRELLRQETPVCFCAPCCDFVPSTGVRILTQYVDRATFWREQLRWIASLRADERNAIGATGRAIFDHGVLR